MAHEAAPRPPTVDVVIWLRGVPDGGVVIDVGCGAGRALPALHQAVGSGGTVVALDRTTEMLVQAHAQGRGAYAALSVADARHLPLADMSVDAVFAAGLIERS